MASDIYHLNFENFSKVFLYDKDDKIIASGTLVSYDSQAQILDSSITLREENSNETYTDFSKIGEIYTDFSKIGFEMTIDELTTALSKIQKIKNKTYNGNYYADADLKIIKDRHSKKVKDVDLDYRGGKRGRTIKRKKSKRIISRRRKYRMI
jgi:hypothetical protein